ncbi:MAG: alpha/beta hydrolase [Pseudomonadota bacterium]
MMRTSTLKRAAAAALLLAAASAHAAPPAGQDAYTGAQVKVDVGDRKLNLYCIGKGSPTVLFEADAGRSGWDWSAVQPEVAKRTRTCVYDRAGLGFSDPATRVSTSGNASKDLNFLIKNARMDGPFVLVGAGFGAMVVQQFAWRARGTVTGLVLVEPRHEDSLPQPKEQAAMLDAAMACLTESTQGAPGPDCAYGSTGINGEIGPKLAAAQAAQVARPNYWRARASEIDNLAVSAGQLRAARKPFGDMPVSVVQQGEPSAIVAAVMEVLDKQH